MLRSGPPLQSNDSVASQRQALPKKKNERAGGCIFGLSLRLLATSDGTDEEAAIQGIWLGRKKPQPCEPR